ncbi:MAG: monovalent cation/H(+) antiporter subunit G [Candidatus Omnitrophica bacterium]|nr:monovalent cation/H(+) antiporter subunit G [Candidatus Omnitrophota bacterium]
MNELIGKIFIILGIIFDIFASIGLLRMPDVYNRLQATTKCVTLGTCSILFGVFVMKPFTDTGIKALLCMVFLLLTAPVAAHALARGAHKSGVKLWKNSVCDKYLEDRGQEVEDR